MHDSKRALLFATAALTWTTAALAEGTVEGADGAAPNPADAAAPAPADAGASPTQADAAAPPAADPAPTQPPAPLPDPSAAPSFGADPFGAVAAATDLQLKLYGDTGCQVRTNADQSWKHFTANPNVYAVGNTFGFFAPRVDLFGSANIDKLSFTTEIMFDANGNGIGVDIERIQVSYLFNEYLRLQLGRMHVASGYYNDTYHHGNIFELTTGRPYTVQFEDSFGIVPAHLVGVHVDGTFKLGSTLLRYDLEAGNPRPQDVTGVAMQYSEESQPSVNGRLRWTPIDGLMFGVSAMRGVIPSLSGSDPGGYDRPKTEEIIIGGHAVYTEHHFLIDVEGFWIRHNPVDAITTNTFAGFAEVGYTIDAFTPYVRGEYLHFPPASDPIYQWTASDAQGKLAGEDSIYVGIQNMSDLRIGMKWLAMPQLAFKIEGSRLDRGTQHQEIGTFKAAFGF